MRRSATATERRPGERAPAGARRDICASARDRHSGGGLQELNPLISPERLRGLIS